MEIAESYFNVIWDSERLFMSSGLKPVFVDYSSDEDYMKDPILDFFYPSTPNIIIDLAIYVKVNAIDVSFLN